MTRSDILKLQASGKIRGHNLGRLEVDQDKRIQLPHILISSPAKDYIELNLQYWCNEHAVTLEREFKFDPIRKWRFDWVIKAYKIAVEFEGFTPSNRKGGHTTIGGYTSNTEKYNAAAIAGYKVLRFTFKNYKSLNTELNKCI